MSEKEKKREKEEEHSEYDAFFFFGYSGLCFVIFKKVYHGYSVKRSISSNTEVGSRNIVGDSGRNHHNGNTELLILLSSLHHLQTTGKRLAETERKEGVKYH